MGDLLELRDIHLPEAVAWWPPAPGWWLLLAASVVLSVCVLLGLRHFRQTWARRRARAEFQVLREAFREDADVTRLAAGTLTLLRRVCLTYFERDEVAALTGRRWLEFLDRAWADVQAPARFASPQGEAWLATAYGPDSRLDGDALIAMCAEWLRALPPRTEAP